MGVDQDFRAGIEQSDLSPKLTTIRYQAVLPAAGRRGMSSG